MKNDEEYRQALKKAHSRLRSVITPQRNRGEDPADPMTVQAMPLVLHIPKKEDATAPTRHDLMAAAARACVLTCLDARAGQDSFWSESLTRWYDARIRKVTRRARASRWESVQVLSGVTVEHNHSQARAFLPSPVSMVEPKIQRLQITGTDVEGMSVASAEELPSGVPLILVDDSLGMSVGKAAAQAAHGAMLLAAAMETEGAVDWYLHGCPLEVRGVSGELFTAYREQLLHGSDAEQKQWLTISYDPELRVMVTDAGYTEIAPDTATVIALFPQVCEEPRALFRH